jgi:hypothetical protein
LCDTFEHDLVLTFKFKMKLWQMLLNVSSRFGLQCQIVFINIFGDFNRPNLACYFYMTLKCAHQSTVHRKKKCFWSIFPAINVHNCLFNSSVNIWSCLYKQVKIKNFNLYKMFMMATLIIDTNRLSVTSDTSDLSKSNSEYFNQVHF